MKNKKLIVLFYLNKQRGKNGRFPIYLRLRIGRNDKSEISIGEYINPNDWDTSKNRPKKDDWLTKHLNKIENEIIEIKRTFEDNCELYTTNTIKTTFLGDNHKNKKDVLLMNFMDNHLEQLSRRQDIEGDTVKQYYRTRKYLFEFLSKKDLVKIPIKKFSIDILKEFDLHLQNKENVNLTGNFIKKNTINKYHRKLRAVLYQAQNSDIIDKNPYKKFSIKDDKVNRIPLSENEIYKLINFDISYNDSLDRVKDNFIFSIFTGLRFSDAQSLIKNNIVEENGRLWLCFTQKKTNNFLKMPLLDEAILIYNKYNQLRDATGRILPKISNQKLNVYLKEICKLSGIKKNITHHTARHTFASTILVARNINYKISSYMIGHSSIKSTEIYTKVDDNLLLQIADKLNKENKVSLH